MPEPITEMQPTPTRTPYERVARWQPLLEENGWDVSITHTGQRARLDATRPSGSAIMVTAGTAGRSNKVKDRTQLYVLDAGRHKFPVWETVNAAGFEQFARDRIVRRGHRVPSKCLCRTSADRPKTRYVTESRAGQAMKEASRHRRAEGAVQPPECRVYRCPDDDRVWHVTSRAVWENKPGDSALWNAQ